MDKNVFALRLARLRTNKGVSARDMSLNMGQNPGYINNIESGKSLPSLTCFFYICEYLDITPGEFFDVETHDPSQIAELKNVAKGLTSDQLSCLIALIKEMKK